MSVETEIQARLAGYAGLIALVGLSPWNGVPKIYPLTIPQQEELPAVTFMKVSDVPEHAMGSDADIKTVRMQVDCWAETFDDMKAIEDQVKDALNRYRGENIKDCLWENTSHFFDNDTFHSAIDFTVFYGG
jgi:hypothetical protein